MAPTHLRAHARRLDQVPAQGEVVQLNELGTHSLGALCLNGARVASPELLARMDQISRGFEGFFFGRYDLRAKSADSLRAGRDFKILELNGLTSEAMHVYEPGTPLREGYRVLFRQWQLAFEIAAENRRRGHETLSLAQTLSLLVRGRAPQKPQVEHSIETP